MTDSAVRSFALDASVGVKWFRRETGQEDALSLLRQSEQGIVRLYAPTHFAHEVLAVIGRRNSPDAIVPAWEALARAGVSIVPLTEDVVREAAVQCAALGCTFYDSLAPAVASLLHATLVSADAKAHGAYPGVRLIG